LATVRYPVLEVTATVEPFENGRGFSFRVLRVGKPRTSCGQCGPDAVGQPPSRPVKAKPNVSEFLRTLRRNNISSRCTQLPNYKQVA
jgi:hypothetical protein